MAAVSYSISDVQLASLTVLRCSQETSELVVSFPPVGHYERTLLI